MLEPKDISIQLPNGNFKIFTLSKFPAVAGREIVTQYPSTALPKIGDYGVNEGLMLKLMTYVGIPQPEGRPPLMLVTRELVDNHVPDFETLMKIEMAMMEYNCSFFAQGKMSGLFEVMAGKVQQLILKTLTDFSAQSSGQTKQP